MPNLSVILSIYILFVAVFPCHCDMYGACENGDIPASITQAQHDDEQSAPDVCTPFCSCASSHSANAIALIYSLSGAGDRFEKQQAFYISKKEKSFFPTPYTPPELA